MPEAATLAKYSLTQNAAGRGKYDITYTWYKNATPGIVNNTKNVGVGTTAIVADMAAVQTANAVTFQ